jgi:hypothetical protein
LKNFKTQVQMNTKQLQWHDALALMYVNLIHKPGCKNVLLDVLSRWEELQSMDTTQVFQLIYKGKGNLKLWIIKGYMKDLETQRLVGKLKSGKKLKEIKFVDELLKYKQNWMYVLLKRLRLLVLKEEHNSPHSQP